MWPPLKQTGTTTSQERRPGRPAANNSFFGPSSCCRKPPRKARTIEGTSSRLPEGVWGHWDNLWESRGGSMVNQYPRVIPKSTQYPWGKIEGPLRDFVKANLRPHPRPDQRPKIRGAPGPKVFWPLVWPRMCPSIRL